MSVKITNAVVQNGDVTVTSAQFVVAGGLSYEERVRTLSTLVQHAAASLDLPDQGPIAAEILYRIADDRAGAAPLKPAQTETVETAPKKRDWKNIALGAAFWVGFVALVVGAAALKHAG
jgi:hypothetical protein